jgi:hypothetical protein
MAVQQLFLMLILLKLMESALANVGDGGLDRSFVDPEPLP